MLLKENCFVLFVGINPSLEPSQVYFVTAKNQFFKLLQASGMDHALNDEETHNHYNVGFINYVDLPTKTKKDISNSEMAAGKDILNDVVKCYQPALVCFVGKKCCKYHLYVSRTSNQVEFGKQERTINTIPVWCVPHGSTKSLLPFEEKLKYVDKQFFFHQIINKKKDILKNS